MRLRREGEAGHRYYYAQYDWDNTTFDESLANRSSRGSSQGCPWENTILFPRRLLAVCSSSQSSSRLPNQRFVQDCGQVADSKIGTQTSGRRHPRTRDLGVRLGPIHQFHGR